jgi:elongation factor P--(R)-beta-lysine ligase
MIPMASFAALEKRAELLRRLREFFRERGFLEVETPLVADEVIPELHIEPLRLENGQFLQASPELAMKCLLAAGAQAIFQVTHSFRAGERGQLHNPEFTIVEWYRVGDGMSAGMDLIDELMQELLGVPAALRTTYAEAFEIHAGVNPLTASLDELATGGWARASGEPPDGPEPGGSLSLDPSHPELELADRDEWLNLILAKCVEPNLGRERPEIIYHYPASQASLAKTVTLPGGHEVAERFELYYRGIELANGYHELSDAQEQRRRFEAVNAARLADGRPALPMPEDFLAALERGLPECTGVGLGFDRLAMLAAGATAIDDVLAFPAK